MAISPYYNIQANSIPPKYRKFTSIIEGEQKENGKDAARHSLPPPKHRFIQTVALYLPSRLLTRIPGASGPMALPASRNIPSPSSQPTDVNHFLEQPYISSRPSSVPSRSSTRTRIPQRAHHSKSRRMPRSEMRAFYRTLTIPELEKRVDEAAKQLREVILEYIYATHKPDAPFPSIMQLRMHPPIARVAQDLDEVDQALKLARQAERLLRQPFISDSSAGKMNKVAKKAKERTGPTLIPDPNNPGQWIKRGRGRPRKNPLPPPKHPIPVPEGARVETTLTK